MNPEELAKILKDNPIPPSIEDDSNLRRLAESLPE